MDAFGIASEKIVMLKQFVQLCQVNPAILNLPQLKFFRDWIEDLGGSVPSGPTGDSQKKEPHGESYDQKSNGHDESEAKPSYADAAKGKTAWGAKEEEPSSESEESESSESEELMMDDLSDDENVIIGDNDPPQDMGDDTKEPTDAEQDEAMNMRSLGMQALGNGDNEGAIQHFTAGIKLDNTKTVFFVKRGTAYLRLKKPNAAIRDCRKALSLNPDSAAAYKTLGKAQKLLGFWDEACHSFEEAQKIDFDEDILMLLKDIKPKAMKIREHKQAMERKQKEKEIKERIKRVKKAQKEQEKARKEQERRQKEEEEKMKQDMPDMSGMFGPGGQFQFPGGGNFSQEDFARFAQQFQQQQASGKAGAAGGDAPPKSKPSPEPQPTPKEEAPTDFDLD